MYAVETDFNELFVIRDDEKNLVGFADIRPIPDTEFVYIDMYTKDVKFVTGQIYNRNDEIFQEKNFYIAKEYKKHMRI